MSRIALRELLIEEMAERKWDIYRVAVQALLKDAQIRKKLDVNILMLEMILADPPLECVLGEQDAQLLEDAFGASKEFFLNCEKAAPVIEFEP